MYIYMSRTAFGGEFIFSGGTLRTAVAYVTHSAHNIVRSSSIYFSNVWVKYSAVNGVGVCYNILYDLISNL